MRDFILQTLLTNYFYKCYLNEYWDLLSFKWEITQTILSHDSHVQWPKKLKCLPYAPGILLGAEVIMVNMKREK